MRVLKNTFLVFILLALLGAGGALYVLYSFGRDLPDYAQLAHYEPPTVSRIHAADGRLVTEYARQRRSFVPIEAMPKRIIKAFLAAEDKNFYSHPGVDFLGIVRALVTNTMNSFRGTRPVGASTITQQVAKNFLLSNEVSVERKIKEAILAFRIERAFTKDRILELYLNEIYLGYGSYGVAAAALNYFNKSLDQLTVAEAAYLAALPKAPNNYHPVRARLAAVARRNWVIGRMVEEGFIEETAGELARRVPIEAVDREETEVVPAAYFVEQVRREISERFGHSALYEGGLSVRTSLHPKLQAYADSALMAGLRDYDRRHGWRGPVTNVGDQLATTGWRAALAAAEPPPGRGAWRMAVAIGIGETAVDIGLGDGSRGQVPLAELSWAREWRPEQALGPRVRRPADVLEAGDVILVEPVTEDGDGAPYPEGTYGLRQIPAVEGAIVALDPHTGRVLALRGGYSYEASEFNRATQARRQPGSAFKPFVYLAALEAGLTPSTLILDAPFVIDQGPGLGKWKPDNYSKTFYGPSPMRLGIEKSRNLMTVRLAQKIGMERVSETATRIGVVDHLPPVLSMALGAGETTLLDLTASYAIFVNGGKRVTPSLVDRIQDRHGQTIYRQDLRACPGCQTVPVANAESAADDGAAVPRAADPASLPDIIDLREQVADPVAAYQVNAMLQGVVERGTGRRIRSLDKPLAGKTGTTNDSMDTWFIGFSPDLVVGVFVGFDTPRSLGERETGSNVAAPVFKSFMAKALADKPSIPFRIPPGVRLVRVDAKTGLPADGDSGDVITEAFRAGTEPERQQTVIGSGGPSPDSASPVGVGGLY